MPRTRKTILRELGDGLTLRRATPADTEALVEFNVRIHCENNPNDTDFITTWTRELMSGNHPTFKPGDFTVVEDTRVGKIVSSLNLISQTWSYGGVKFGLGRPELVGTDPTYRNRGLVRAQFDVVHEWSRQRGELAQAITGIPYFYRQFGYEMTLPLDLWRQGHKSQVSRLKEGEAEPFTVRPATEADLPFFSRTYAHGMSRYLVSCVRGQAIWRHELGGRYAALRLRPRLAVITSAQGKRVGILAHGNELWGEALPVQAYELVGGANWLAVTPSVVRYLVKFGEDYAAKHQKTFTWYRFLFDTAHPVYDVLGEDLRGRERGYAYYMRVPELDRFLRHVAPVLEQRLADSIAVGYTGDLTLWCYGHGVGVRFEGGRLVQTRPLTSGEGASARFPGHTFLHLLFGYRTAEEVSRLYADCSPGSAETKLLLSILFPLQPSHIWGII